MPASIDPALPSPHPALAGADLCAALAALRAGTVTAEALIEAGLAAARGPLAAQAFVALDEAGARAAARRADAERAGGRDPGALAGLAVAVKDLFEVQGQRTGAGSSWLRAAGAPAAADAPAVARLRAAGAALIGRTQMSEFAFSGLGINPHDGTPANPVLATLGRPDCLPGGSTSGGAVAVASGAAWAALGSDTGGSLRIPAALQGLVGFKPTQRLTPLAGTVPLAPSLDTVGAISRSVRDAVRLHELLAARPVALAGRPLRGLRLGWTRRHFLDGLDAEVGAAWQDALARLAAAGAELVELPLQALDRLAELTEGGGITAAEAWAWHAPHLAAHADHYDPRVLARIRRGAAIDADRLARLHALRATWITELAAQTAGVDLMLAPTVPTIAPPIAPLLGDDAAFFATNLAMLRNPMVVNLADGCALSLPCQAPGRAPVGLMLWAAGGRDEALLDAALAIEAVVGPGAAGRQLGRGG